MGVYAYVYVHVCACVCVVKVWAHDMYVETTGNPFVSASHLPHLLGLLGPNSGHQV